jgi:type II secretory pathway component PulM
VNTAIENFNYRWAAIPKPRQRLLIGITLLLAVGLCWAYIVQPILTSRAANTKRISVLQAQLANMQRDSSAIQSLQSIAPVADTNRKIFADSQKLEAIFGVNTKVAAMNDGGFRIESTRVNYADWLTKVDNALSRYRLQIVALEIKTQDSNSVDVSLTFGTSR